MSEAEINKTKENDSDGRIKTLSILLFVGLILLYIILIHPNWRKYGIDNATKFTFTPNKVTRNKLILTIVLFPIL